MLDVRPTAYICPIAEQEIGPLTPIIRVQNFGDEDATITGLVRIYRETLGVLIYSSELAVTPLPHGTSADIAALTPFNPGAPADDDYFVLAEVRATSLQTGSQTTEPLGQYFFDIKPAPMGPVPATHHTTHENGGMDEIALTGLSGLLGDPQTPSVHHLTHEDGGDDEIKVEDLPTVELNDTLVLAPDGIGGVEFRAEAGGVTDHGALTGLADDDHPQYQLRHEVFHENDCLFPTIDNFWPWFDTAIASGTKTDTQGTPTHPGIVRISSSTSANSGMLLSIKTTSLRLAGQESSTFWHRPQTLAGTTRHHGFHDANSVTDPADGAWIWQDPATGIVYGRTRANSVGSTTGTGYQLVTNTWYCEKIIVNADASQVDFYCFDDAGNELWHDSLDTNIPTAAGRELGHGIVATNSGTTAVALDDIDYLSILIPDRRPKV